MASANYQPNVQNANSVKKKKKVLFASRRNHGFCLPQSISYKPDWERRLEEKNRGVAAAAEAAGRLASKFGGATGQVGKDPEAVHKSPTLPRPSLKQQQLLQLQQQQLLQQKKLELQHLQRQQQNHYKRFPLRQQQQQQQPQLRGKQQQHRQQSGKPTGRPLPAPTSYYRSGFGSNNSVRSADAFASGTIPTLKRASGSAAVGTDNAHHHAKAKTPAATRTQSPVRQEVITSL